MNTKHFLLCAAALLMPVAHAQTPTGGGGEGLPFRANLINIEYNVEMAVSLYDSDILVPRQEVYGPLAGYLVKTGTAYYWLVTSATVDADGRSATLCLTNDYGSEDLTATLTCDDDSIYTLKQLKGSTLKVPNGGKWQKLPRTLTLKRKK